MPDVSYDVVAHIYLDEASLRQAERRVKEALGSVALAAPGGASGMGGASNIEGILKSIALLNRAQVEGIARLINIVKKGAPAGSGGGGGSGRRKSSDTVDVKTGIDGLFDEAKKANKFQANLRASVKAGKISQDDAKKMGLIVTEKEKALLNVQQAGIRSFLGPAFIRLGSSSAAMVASLGVIGAGVGIIALLAQNEFSGLKDTFQLLGIMIQLYLKPFADALMPFMLALSLWLMDYMPAWNKAVSSAIEDPFEGILEFDQWVFGLVADMLIAISEYIAEGLLGWGESFSDDIWPFITDLFDDWGENITDFFTAIIYDIGPVIKDAIEVWWENNVPDVPWPDFGSVNSLSEIAGLAASSISTLRQEFSPLETSIADITDKFGHLETAMDGFYWALNAGGILNYLGIGGYFDDVVIPPGGPPIRTSPQDYLFATKDPSTLMGGNGGGGGGSGDTTINITGMVITYDDFVEDLMDKIEVRRREFG